MLHSLLPLAGEGVRRTDEGNKGNSFSSIVFFSESYGLPLISRVAAASPNNGRSKGAGFMPARLHRLPETI